MGMTAGIKPFGHGETAAIDIEGLALLEDHLKQLRAEEGVEDGMFEDDEAAAWDGWDVDSDSDESSEGWMDVGSDGSDLDISDSEDEDDSKKPKAQKKDADGDVDMDVDMDKEGEQEDVEDSSLRISTLATTKILTPADFALLNDLRLKAASDAVEKGGGSATKRKLATLQAEKRILAQGGNEDTTFISENDILGPKKKARADYAERIASIEKGREGREKFGSLKGKKQKDKPSSSTNREKARNKPLMMIIASGAVRGKKKASLREKQRKLRAHIDKAKKSYH
ncbi:hypothetical protein QCA50_007877 [Cerrena zonata]|uniref:Protein SDA1 n=1 Tax=Cerrena zonata TaxID=2478898 RepID=A0AAW0G8V2_9APHY